MRPYLWPSSSGDPIEPKDMSERHLCNALRIVWNMRCPESLRIQGGWVRADVVRWPIERVHVALDALFEEAQRRELDPEQTQILNHILLHGKDQLS